MKIKHLAIIIALALITSTLNGQQARLRCTEVLANGDVLLHWDPVSVGTGFYNYTLYYASALDGAYSMLEVITSLSQDSYQHLNAGADTAPLYYFMVTNTDSGPSPPSDTLATILLSSFTQDFEIIDFTWTALHTTPEFLPDMHPWYLLYREFPPANWSVVDSTQDRSITHHFWPCNGASDTVRFRIGLRNIGTGCISLSNLKAEVLRNLSNRFPPVIDSVSINAGGHALIGWQPGTEQDIVGYKIFRVTSTNDSIDYVAERYNTSYIDLNSDPCNGSLSYIILSIDSCGNESPFPYVPSPPYPDKPQSTIYLAPPDYDPCLMLNRLSWNEYENFEPPLDDTKIYVSVNNGPFEWLAGIPPGQAGYSHENLSPNTSYAYFVRAVSQDPAKTSTSCVQEIRTYNAPYPLFMYLRYVTVVNNEHVDLLFYTDTNAHVQHYRILRSETPAGTFEEAGQVQDNGSEYISFSDYNVDVEASSYYYAIEVVDSCGRPSVIANTAQTVLLQVEALPDYSNRLTWNEYHSWLGRTLGYKVYRRLDDSSPELIASLDSLTLTYTDKTGGFTGSVSRISYIVEAYEGDNNPFGFRESSWSNEVLSSQEPRIYVPNAFMPKGLNNTLKPVNVFVPGDGYEFVIYNRWGQLMFITTDPGEGWNGKYNGQYVPQDVYVYLIRFRNALNQPRQTRGNVAVIY